MDVYQIWFELKPGTDEGIFSKALGLFLDHLEGERMIETWRLLRCKLGLKPDAFPEFVLLVETEDLAQLDRAFKAASTHQGEVDSLQFSANAMVEDVKFALYRDWPDA